MLGKFKKHFKEICLAAIVIELGYVIYLIRWYLRWNTGFETLPW